MSRRPGTPDAAKADTRPLRKCANYAGHNVCNWMVPADSDVPLCPACRPNRTIPNLDRPGHAQKWCRCERGKRPTFYGLMRLGLPIA